MHARGRKNVKHADISCKSNRRDGVVPVVPDPGCQQTLRMRCRSRSSLQQSRPSTANVLAVLVGEVLEQDNLLGELDVVTEVAGAIELGENIDDGLLLVQLLPPVFDSLVIPWSPCE